MLIDTSGFLSLYERTEAAHEKAVELYDSAAIRFTTNYILTEYTALAQIRGIPRAQIIEFSETILEDPAIEIVWINEITHRQAVALTGQRPDKTYSLCDAASFVVMKERKIADALTTDKHFEQEGFRRLL